MKYKPFDAQNSATTNREERKTLGKKVCTRSSIELHYLYESKYSTRVHIYTYVLRTHPFHIHREILWQYKSKRLISSGKILCIRAINKKKLSMDVMIYAINQVIKKVVAIIFGCTFAVCRFKF